MSVKNFDAKFSQQHFSFETLLEYRTKIDQLLGEMERNLQRELSNQEMEFQKTFNDQMKAVQDTFQDLKSRIDKTLSKEKTDKKYAGLAQEKNFFMNHSLYLNEQNQKLTERLRLIKEELKNTQSERDYYRREVVELRGRYGELGESNEEMEKRMLFLAGALG